LKNNVKMKELQIVQPAEWSVSELVEHCLKTPPDEAAWSEFVRRFQPTISRRVAQALTRLAKNNSEYDGFSQDLMEDLVQAVYMRLIRRDRQALTLFKGEHENSIYRYILIISINVVRDHFREVRALKRPNLMYSLDELLSRGAGALAGEEAEADLFATKSEDSKKLLTAETLEDMFCQMKPWTHQDRDITVFKLKYFQGLTNREIAAIKGLQLSPEGVGASVGRTLKRIKTFLKKRKRAEQLENSRR
jgi:RNA polymerase sigma factor (sigma-70 family)